MSIDLDKIIKRQDTLFGHQQLFASTWQEIADYMMPRKSVITTKKTPGAKQTEKLFDSTAINASELLAATLNGSLTSAAMKWFTLKMRETELNEVKEIAEWLEGCAKRMYLSFAQSNFNSEIHEVYLDLVTFGTGALLVEENEAVYAGFNGFRFESLQLGDYAIAEDVHGRVKTIYRRFKKSAEAAVEEWGSAVGERIKEKSLKNPDTMIEFVHCVYRNPDKQDIERPYISLTIARQERQLVSEAFYEEFPFMVARWSKTSGEVYGRGPGHTALPDVKSLNKAVELNFKAWGIQIQPPMLAEDDSIIGDISIVPGGIIWYQPGRNPPKALDLNTNFNLHVINEEKLKKSIRSIFHSDQIETLLAANGPQKTATEIQIQYEIIQQLLGPTLGRLESELLDPLIIRSFNLMWRAGAFRQMPDILMSIGGNIQYDIRYESPLVRAQRSSDVVAIQRLNGFVTEVVQQSGKPEVVDVIDHDKAVKEVANILGVPAGIIRDDEEIQQIRQARTQALAQQNEKQNMLDMAEGMKKAAPIMKEMNNG